MKDLQNITSIYCDGGVISRNPSPHGGTYAFYFLNESGEEVGQGSGLVLPKGGESATDHDWWGCELDTISNNVTELAAVVFALQKVEKGFEGTLYTDSWVTLCRMQNTKSNWNGVPDGLKEAALHEKARHPRVKYVLLDGHPTKAQLEAKIGKRGNPCSEWNVACDKRCGEVAKAFLAIRSKTFYRVNHEKTQQGLWYGFDGIFTGLIHNRFGFCQNRDLKMDFDSDLRGYISAVETLDQLFAWFSREDILQLQAHGFYIHEYSACDFRWYDRFNHYVINQSSSTLIRKIPLDH